MFQNQRLKILVNQQDASRPFNKALHIRYLSKPYQQLSEEERIEIYALRKERKKYPASLLERWDEFDISVTGRSLGIPDSGTTALKEGLLWGWATSGNSVMHVLSSLPCLPNRELLHYSRVGLDGPIKRPISSDTLRISNHAEEELSRQCGVCCAHHFVSRPLFSQFWCTRRAQRASSVKMNECIARKGSEEML